MKYHIKTVVVVLIVSTIALLNASIVVSPITALAEFRKRTITNKELPELIKLLATKENVDYKKLIRLANCESTMRHYENGKVLRGYVNKNDGGVFQINRPT